MIYSYACTVELSASASIDLMWNEGGRERKIQPSSRERTYVFTEDKREYVDQDIIKQSKRQ